MLGDITVQVPVFNETKALRFSSFYFDRLGIPARYVLDCQRTPQAEKTLKDLGKELIVFENDKPFIENGYQGFCAASPTDWILRIDCDEVPAATLIDHAIEFVRTHDSGVAGFERHQLLWKDDRFLTAKTARFAPPNQRQWRLFNRKHIGFNPAIHTPGIHLSEAVEMRSEAALFHLSWVFLSGGERLRKAQRYDDHGQAAPNRENQLFPLEKVDWDKLDAPFLTDTFRDWLSQD